MKFNRESILVIIGSFSYNVVNGGVFIWGTISIYLASYFRLYDPSVSTSLLLLFSPIRGILLLILLPLGSLFEMKYNKKMALLFSITSFLICILICIITTNYLIFVSCFALAFAINTSFGFSMVQEAAWKYYPKNRGLISGLCNCGFIVSTIISFSTHYFVNWDNVKPSLEGTNSKIVEYYYTKEVAVKCINMLIILMLIWACFFAISYFTIRYPSEEFKLEQQQEMKSLSPNKNMERATIELYQVNFKDALTSKIFLLILIINSLAFFMDFQVSYGYKQLGQIYNYSDLFLTLIGSIYPAINSSSRILFGYLSDKFKLETVLIVGLILQAISFGLLPQVAGSPIVFTILIILYSFSAAAHASLFNLLIIKVFGASMAGNMINYLLISVAMGNLLVFVLNFYLLPMLGFLLYFRLFMLLLGLAIFLIHFTKFEIIWKIRENELETMSPDESDLLRRRSTLMF